MHEQLPRHAPARTAASRARRFMLAASLSCAASVAAHASAQNASKPRSAQKPTATRAAQPKVEKAQDAPKEKPAPSTAATAEKPAPPSSETTRARRAATTSATPRATAATPAVAAPLVDAPAAAAAAVVPASKEDAAAKAVKSDDAELERLRTEIKGAKPGAERARLQRSLVDRLVALKRRDEALDTLRLMIHEDRYDPPFFFNTGNALARLGDASAAEDAYRKAIHQRRGNYARALNNLGVILIRQGHWDEARETLASALIQENNTYAEASYNLGRLYLLRGEADLAIREWHRTLQLDPQHTEAAAALARTYAEDGSVKRGLAVLDGFIARSTHTGSAVPREIAEARRELVEAAPVGDADNATVANVKTSARKDAAAGANFRPREVDLATYKLLQTARAHRESGSYEESVKHYRGVLARSPGGYFPPANLELGASLINLKRDEEAIAALAPLTERDAGRYPVAYYHLGRLYERQGQLQRAAQSFARAAELYGDSNPQVFLDLSRTHEKSGDAAGALAAMNAYAAAIARQGSVPDWVTARQAKLAKQQKDAAPAPKQ